MFSGKKKFKFVWIWPKIFKILPKFLKFHVFRQPLKFLVSQNFFPRCGSLRQCLDSGFKKLTSPSPLNRLLFYMLSPKNSISRFFLSRSSWCSGAHSFSLFSHLLSSPVQAKSRSRRSCAARRSPSLHAWPQLLGRVPVLSRAWHWWCALLASSDGHTLLPTTPIQIVASNGCVPGVSPKPVAKFSCPDLQAGS
jgi:hypothetical protein